MPIGRKRTVRPLSITNGCRHKKISVRRLSSNNVRKMWAVISSIVRRRVDQTACRSKETNDTTPFDNEWVQAQENIYKTFVEQQRKENLGPYKFERTTPRGSDTLQVDGYGYPVNPVGLIC